MESQFIPSAATFAWLAAICSVYLGFVLSGKLARSGKRLLAATVPIWVFMPTTLLLQFWQGGVSGADIWAIVGFAGVLALVTWGHMRHAK